MVGKENTRIKEFLMKNNASAETITTKQMANLEKVDKEIQRRNLATTNASAIIRANSINISSIAKATGISNKTFYNNSLLKNMLKIIVRKMRRKLFQKTNFLN